MHGEQGFVSRDHMLARCNRLHHERLGNAIAANEFDHDINLWIGNHSARIAHYLHLVADHRFGARRV